MININKDALQFGLVASFISGVIFLLGYFAGLNPFEGSSWFTIISSLLLMGIGIRYIKKYQFQSSITFVQTLKLSLEMVIPYFIFYCLMIFITVQANILNELPERVKKSMIEKIELQKEEIIKSVGNSGYEDTLDEAKKVRLSTVVANHLIMRGIWLALFSIIASVYFRT